MLPSLPCQGRDCFPGLAPPLVGSTPTLSRAEQSRAGGSSRCARGTGPGATACPCAIQHEASLSKLAIMFGEGSKKSWYPRTGLATNSFGSAAGDLCRGGGREPCEERGGLSGRVSRQWQKQEASHSEIAPQEAACSSSSGQPRRDPKQTPRCVRGEGRKCDFTDSPPHKREAEFR